MAKERMVVESPVCPGKLICGLVFVSDMNDMKWGQERQNGHELHEILRTAL
jgi:hypothetical protein